MHTVVVDYLRALCNISCFFCNSSLSRMDASLLHVSASTTTGVTGSIDDCAMLFSVFYGREHPWQALGGTLCAGEALAVEAGRDSGMREGKSALIVSSLSIAA